MRAAVTVSRTTWTSAAKRSRRCRGRGCRSARRPGSGPGRWRARGRWRRAAARRRTGGRDGASGDRKRPRRSRRSTAARRAAAAGAAGQELGQHHVLERGKVGQQVVELVDEADPLAAQAGPLGVRYVGSTAGRRSPPRPRSGARAGRRCAAASICRSLKGRRAPPAGRAAARGRRPFSTSSARVALDEAAADLRRRIGTGVRQRRGGGRAVAASLMAQALHRIEPRGAERRIERGGSEKTSAMPAIEGDFLR